MSYISSINELSNLTSLNYNTKKLNLRQKRTKKFNEYVNSLWKVELYKYKSNKYLKNINLDEIDKIDINVYFNNKYNYSNQIYEQFYFYKINKFILAGDDEDNVESDDISNLLNTLELEKILKVIKNHKDCFYLNEYRRYLAVYKIQQWWKPIFFNPRNKFISPYLENKMNSIYNF